MVWNLAIFEISFDQLFCCQSYEISVGSSFFFVFFHIWNFIAPTDELIFFRGVAVISGDLGVMRIILSITKADDGSYSVWGMIPRCSMYGIFTYIWVIFGVNLGKYSIHGAYGIVNLG